MNMSYVGGHKSKVKERVLFLVSMKTGPFLAAGINSISQMVSAEFRNRYPLCLYAVLDSKLRKGMNPIYARMSLSSAPDHAFSHISCTSLAGSF